MIVLEYDIRRHWQELGLHPDALDPLRASPALGRIQIL